MTLLNTLLISLLVASTGADQTFYDQEPILNGTWRGTSTCETQSSSCKDEIVVYHLKDETGSNVVKVSAGQIVDGKTIDMGPLEFAYDKEKKTLTNKSGNRVWQLTIRGTQLLGTLVSDGSVFRKVALTRD
jgi:hypothetical protein